MRTQVAVMCSLFVVGLTLIVAKGPAETLPKGFVDLSVRVPGIVIEPRYAGAMNFIGKPVDGYEAERCLATEQTAAALVKVQRDLKPYGLGLKVFDAYRPQRAVNHFVRWAKDKDDTATKARYYPNVAKKDLIPEDYIAPKSGHTRGSAVDLTIVDLQAPHEELDMGSGFDHFGPLSHSANPKVSQTQRANRLLLRTVMERHGFGHYAKEWWHFSLKKEPYPSTYFDFPIR